MSASSKFFANTSEKVTGRLKYWMQHHPIISNSILCLNLWVAGDFAAQYSEMKCLPHHSSKKEQAAEPSFWNEVDVFRTAKCAGYGATVTGPLLATWYPFLERVCVNNSIAARYGLWGPPVLKVLADEFLMDPPCLALFFGYMNVCEGGTIETFKKKMETQFLPSWLTSLAVWPFILLSTFRYAPTYAQAPIINVCLVAWNGFLSHRNTLSKHQEASDKKIEGHHEDNAESEKNDPEDNLRIAFK